MPDKEGLIPTGLYFNHDRCRIAVTRGQARYVEGGAIMTVQDFLKENPTTDTNKVRPHIFCKDGLELSVQASSGHYCAPREDNAEEYTHVEVLCPILIVRSLCKYSKSGDVCAMVPVEAVDNVIKRHGGIVHIGWR